MKENCKPIQKMEPLIKANGDEVYKTLLPIVQTDLPPTLNTARFINSS